MGLKFHQSYNKLHNKKLTILIDNRYKQIRPRSAADALVGDIHVS